jgi:hypothetical protein
MMGCLVVGLKGRSLGLGLPATIEARQHDPGGNGSRGRLAGGRRELESYRRSFSLDERRREEEKGYGMVKQMGMEEIPRSRSTQRRKKTNYCHGQNRRGRNRTYG